MTIIKVIPKNFYQDDPRNIAIELLGKIVMRRYQRQVLSGYIVETEAYYGRDDPSSRARRGGKLADMMHGDVGIALIYGVHGQWLFNIIAHESEKAGAVLIRAIHPLKGVNLMKRLRKTNKLKMLTSGPGRWTQAFAIDKGFHGKPVYSIKEDLKLVEGIGVKRGEIGYSHRIGVTKDLHIPLRFYIRDDPYVSKRVKIKPLTPHLL